jgi:hypothetical protein
VEALDKAAANNASNLAEGVQHLIKLAKSIQAEQADLQEEPKEEDKTASSLAYDTYAANSELADQILTASEEVVDKIDSLVEAGRKFNAAKARKDVLAVTSKVAGILRTDLTASWVREDLTKLASRAEELHTLFVK